MPLVVLLSGCGQDAVRATPFGGSDSPSCEAVADHWPTTVGGLEPRVTAVQSRGVAAWGDPPVVARCGKAPPGPTEDPCIDVSGIDWVATELEDGTMFTTFGRDPAVEVLVPVVYDTAPLWLPAFADAVSQVEQTLGECTSAQG
ncbi:MULTISPECIES: DUF3515 family protein [unclassified Ornithinimicrobium]|uniref:DUF3515 family protein n=1 Tax=unclassified Ornithinimicrobium TaxID=2615080 RepID=UPI003851CF10